MRDRVSPPWGRLALAVLVFVGILVFVIRATSDRGAGAEGAAIGVAGRAETVFDWSSQACAPENIPDLPVRAFRDYRGRVQLILAHDVNRRMVGPSLDRVGVDCAVTMRSTRNPDPAAFDDAEWIGSVFTRDGRPAGPHPLVLVQRRHVRPVRRRWPVLQAAARPPCRRLHLSLPRSQGPDGHLHALEHRRSRRWPLLRSGRGTRTCRHDLELPDPHE